MMMRHWMGSISLPLRRHASVVRVADTILDWIAHDRERRALAALDDRALADFGANRCDVEAQQGLSPRDIPPRR